MYDAIKYWRQDLLYINLVSLLSSVAGDWLGLLSGCEPVTDIGLNVCHIPYYIKNIVIYISARCRSSCKLCNVENAYRRSVLR